MKKKLLMNTLAEPQRFIKDKLLPNAHVLPAAGVCLHN